MNKVPSAVRVRRAAFDDAAAIGHVHIESWRAAYRGILAAEYLDAMSDVRHAAMWSDVLNKQAPNRATFVAEADGEGIVGFADCGPERSGIARTGEITAIYVLPAWQRRGLGRGLIANAARHLAAYEFEQLVIWALRDNPWRAFYGAIGGRVASEREIRFAGQPLQEVCYAWVDIAELLLLDYGFGRTGGARPEAPSR